MTCQGSTVAVSTLLVGRSGRPAFISWHADLISACCHDVCIILAASAWVRTHGDDRSCKYSAWLPVHQSVRCCICKPSGLLVIAVHMSEAYKAVKRCMWHARFSGSKLPYLDSALCYIYVYIYTHICVHAHTSPQLRVTWLAAASVGHNNVADDKRDIGLVRHHHLGFEPMHVKQKLSLCNNAIVPRTTESCLAI